MKYYIQVTDRKVQGGVKGKFLWNRLTDRPIGYYIISRNFKVTNKKGEVFDRHNYSVRI